MNEIYNFKFDLSFRYRLPDNLKLRDAVTLIKIYNAELEFKDVLLNEELIKEVYIIYRFEVYTNRIFDFIRLKEETKCRNID